jgi:hypothetical protein
MAARQAHGLDRQDQAHRVFGQVGAGADTVRQHQVALQLGQLVVRDAALRQLAKAGVDAVDHGVGVDDVLHRGLRGAHAGPGRFGHGQAHFAAVDAAQVGQGDLTRLQGQQRAGSLVVVLAGAHLYVPVYTA